MAARPRPRIAVISGMMAYFETIMEPGFRDDRRRHAGRVTGLLAEQFNLHDCGLWAEEADTPAVAARLAAACPDVILLLPTMATPPGELVAMLPPDLPVVIGCAHALHEVGADYDMAALCRHSVNVGALMLGAMLRRKERARPLIIAGSLGDPAFHDRISLALSTAALAARMNGLRVGRLGMPMPGYDHVGLDDEQAAAAGVELVDIAIEDWAARVAAITSADVDTFIHDNLPALVPPATRIERGEDLRRASRLALALGRLVEEEELDCGSLTCRGPFGTGLEDGAIGCLATSLLTGSGRPFSATGDLLTAIAMFIGRALGGATLYCELDAIDTGRDAFLVANTGEGDFAWCPPGCQAAIRAANAYSGREVPGVVLSHDLAEGPATMLGVVVDAARTDRLALLSMQGRVQEPAHTALQVTNGWFRPESHMPGAQAFRVFEAWADAGATHHGALSPGALDEACGWLGQLISWPVTVIKGGHE